VISASNHTTSAASSAPGAVSGVGANGSAPGRKSTPRLRPAAGADQVLDLGVGLGARELGIELEPHQLGHREAERARELAAHHLGDERLRPLPGAAELAHVHAVVVGLDEPRQRPALAQRRDVARRDDRPHSSSTTCSPALSATLTERPPNSTTTFSRGGVQPPSRGPMRSLPAVAFERAPRVGAVLVRVAVARVLVERGAGRARRPARGDPQRQLVGRRAGVRERRPQRDRRVGARVQRGPAERGVRDHMHRPVDALAGEPVHPRPLGDVDLAVLAAGARDRRQHQVAAEHELVVGRVGDRVVRVLVEQRAQDRRAGAVALLEQRVEVGQQPHAQLEHVAADAGVGLAERPRLLMHRALRRVVAAERLERAELGEAREQLAVAVVEEAADVDADPREPGQAEVLELGHAHPQVLPPRRVVAGPVHRVALEAGVAGAADHERAAVRPRREEALARRLGHQRAVEVVDLPVQPRRGVARVHDVLGHRRLLGDEQRRLVHVAPHARDARSTSAW
jgi:hypothetical protein